MNEGKRFQNKGDHAGILVLDFSTSRTVSNTFLFFISYPTHGVYYSNQAD